MAGLGLVQVRDLPLAVDEVVSSITPNPSAGAVVVFVGQVRDHHGGRAVTGLDYSAHPSAETELRRCCDRVLDRHTAVSVAIVHRTGSLQVGDYAVVAAVGAAHRGQAFAACEDLIEDLKATVPIWKEEHFADGSSAWSGLP